jgi:hypothetical protein
MKCRCTLVGLALLAGCGAVPRPQPISVVAPPPIRKSGLERVLGQDARSLVAQFGPANQDVLEANARKLQFSGPVCILDAYLYPPARGKEPLVMYVDARQPDGRSIDSVTCAAALARRK